MPSFDEILRKNKQAAPAQQPAKSAQPSPPIQPTEPDPFAALKTTMQTPATTGPAPIAPDIERALAQEFNFPGQDEQSQEDIAKTMREMFQALHDNLGGDKVSENLDRVLKHIHQHPFLRDVIQPDDVHLISKAVQASSGFVIQKKVERKSKTSAKKVQDDALMNAMLSGLTMGQK